MNEKKKVFLKKYGLEKGNTRTKFAGGGSIFNKGLGNISKKRGGGGLARKGWKQNREGG